jgi:DNA-binding FrmR family transcriptional regulator
MGTHDTHPEVLNRLKRAAGHLGKIIKMIENQEECLAVAQQLQAVVNAISAAKTIHVQDHIEHCLEEVLSSKKGNPREHIHEFREIAKYL